MGFGVGDTGSFSESLNDRHFDYDFSPRDQLGLSVPARGTLVLM